MSLFQMELVSVGLGLLTNVILANFNKTPGHDGWRRKILFGRHKCSWILLFDVNNMIESKEEDRVQYVSVLCLEWIIYGL